MRTVQFVSRVFAAILALIFYALSIPKPVYAQSCQVALSPTTISTNSSSSLSFSVTNTGSETVIWVQVATSALDYWRITGGSASGWTTQAVEENGESVYFIDGSLETEQTAAFSVTVSVGEEEFGPSAFTVYMASSGDGSGAWLCSGSTDVTAVVASPTDSPTSTPAPTTTTATTATTTTTTTTTVTPTPKPADKTPPLVSLTTDLSEPLEQAPEISGKASDSSRIVKVDYSTDGGVNWLPVDNIDNLGSKSVSFNFIPSVFDDGNYDIVVRAIDGAENTGRSKSYTLIIDRLPPLVGGNIWSIGPIPLLPGESGVITTLSGVDNKITMSAIGGPISIDLMVGGTAYPMVKSAGSGLWSGIVNFKSTGRNTIKVKSIDGAGNETLRDLNPVLVLEGGEIKERGTDEAIKDAQIGVYQQDSLSKVWSLWEGVSFGQKNKQTTDESGGYSYFLPPGSYYLTIAAPGYKTLTSKIFNLESSTALNMNFELAPVGKIEIGSWSILLPAISFDMVDIVVNAPNMATTEENKNTLIGTETPGFHLPKVGGGELNPLSLRGEPQVIIFINTWLPGTSEQISIVKSLPEKYRDRVSFVVTEENLSKTSIFVKRGGYDDLTFAADPDGVLVESYKINSLPSGYFIDRKGLIQKISSGIISGGDIINYRDSF